MDMSSFSSAHRILRKDLRMKLYKMIIDLLLKDWHKTQRKKIRRLSKKKVPKMEDTIRILFPMKKCLILMASITVKMVVYGPFVNREEANWRSGKEQQRKYAEKVMVWLAVCSEDVVPLVLFEKGTLDRHRYIKEVVLDARRYGNSKFGNNWTFEQDNGTPHTHQETQD